MIGTALVAVFMTAMVGGAAAKSPRPPRFRIIVLGNPGHRANKRWRLNLLAGGQAEARPFR